MAEITICTPNCGTAGLLEANWKLQADLNGGPPARWVVVENTNPAEPGAVGDSDPRFHVVRGVPSTEAAKWGTNYRYGIQFGSYQHGGALNIALQHVNTRWVVLTEPDFIAIRPGWIAAVTEHMERNQIGIFGAPFPPYMWRKYLYFPTAMWMCIDLKRVPVESLDFTPILTPRTKLQRLVEKYCYRLIIGRSTDTGWRVYERYRNSSTIRHESLQPSWKVPPKGGPFKRFLIKFIPDCFLLTRWREGFATDQSFASCGFPDAGAVSSMTDEYFWQDEPFCFHTRVRVQSVAPEALHAFIASFARPEVTGRFGRPDTNGRLHHPEGERGVLTPR